MLQAHWVGLSSAAFLALLLTNGNAVPLNIEANNGIDAAYDLTNNNLPDSKRSRDLSLGSVDISFPCETATCPSTRTDPLNGVSELLPLSSHTITKRENVFESVIKYYADGLAPVAEFIKNVAKSVAQNVDKAVSDLTTHETVQTSPAKYPGTIKSKVAGLSDQQRQALFAATRNAIFHQNLSES